MEMVRYCFFVRNSDRKTPYAIPSAQETVPDPFPRAPKKRYLTPFPRYPSRTPARGGLVDRVLVRLLLCCMSKNILIYDKYKSLTLLTVDKCFNSMVFFLRICPELQESKLLILAKRKSWLGCH